MLTVNERIQAVMAHYRLNVNQFTKKIGYNNNTIIGKIVNDSNRKPSFDTIMAILKAFPEVNRGWFLLGEGNMMGNVPKGGIKFYSVTLTPENLKGEPQSYLQVAGYEDCDIAVVKHESAMEPIIQSGDIILCKKSTKDFIVYGSPYLIVIKNMVMIRYVVSCDKKDMICLRSNNPEKYADLTIQRTAVIDLYLIRGKISRL